MMFVITGIWFVITDKRVKQTTENQTNCLNVFTIAGGSL